MPEPETEDFLPFPGRVTILPASGLKPLRCSDESGMGFGSGLGLVKRRFHHLRPYRVKLHRTHCTGHSRGSDCSSVWPLRLQPCLPGTIMFIIVPAIAHLFGR